MANGTIELFSAGVYGFEKAPESGGENLSPAKMGVVGWTDQGPTHKPIEVRSVEEFTRVFGGTTNSGLTPIMIRGYFGLGGERAVVVRVAPGDAVAATITADAKFSFTAQGEGVWGNGLSVRIRGNPNYLDRTVGAEAYTKFDIVVIGPSPADPTVQIGKETFEAVELTDPALSDYVVDTMTDPTNGSELVDIAEITPGVPSQLDRAPQAAELIVAASGSFGPFSGTLAFLPLSLTFEVYNDVAVIAAEAVGTPGGGVPYVTGALVLVEGPSLKRGTFIATYDNTGAFTVTDDPTSEDATGLANLIDSFDGSIVGTVNYDTRAYSFTTAQNTTVVAVTVAYTHQYYTRDDGVGFFTFGDIDSSTTNSINYTTGAYLLTLEGDAAGAKGGPFAAPAAVSNILTDYVNLPSFADYLLINGLDGSAVSRSSISAIALEPLEKGIYALDTFDQPLNLVVPDFEGSQTVQSDVVAFCEARSDSPALKNRLYIAGFANGTTVAEAAKYVTIDQVTVFNTKVLAVYYNNVRYRRDDDVVQTVPCTGFVAGIYSRTAQVKNVGRTPAGQGVGILSAPGVVGPEYELRRQSMDTLYQVNINPLFRSDATGFIINGGRLMSLNKRWKYVNARTLNDFLMFRIDRILQFAVFENNGPVLWERASSAVKGFLTSLFRLGYFGGTLPEDAFFVTVDSSNNSRSSNQLNVDVGFTAGTPVEFVVFRVQQPVGAATA
jgi:hypothetical protein